MSPAHRSGADEPLNFLARLRAETKFEQLLDLSDSNPTHHGLTHPRLCDVLARGAAEAVMYDPQPRGPIKALEALAEIVGGHPREYWLTSSTSEAYAWLLATTCDPGEAVAIPVPGYPLVEPLARFSGVRTVGYPLFYLHPYGWSLDVDAFDQTVADPQVKAAVVVSPGNPTGAYLESAQADHVIQSCARHNVVLICDEVFGRFWLDRGSPGPSLGGGSEATVVVLDGLSKSLGAPQVKLGWLRLTGPQTATDAIGRGLDQIADTFLSVGAVATGALPDLLGLVDEQSDRIRARLKSALAIVRAELGAPSRVRAVGGGWSVIVDLPRGVDDETLLREVFRRGVAVQPGWLFDLADRGTIVLSLLTDPDVMTAGCRILKDLADETAAT